MAKISRSIKIAFDKKSGEILDADEVFDITKDAFQIRKKYHEGNIDLSCCECEQDLMVSGSKYDRLYFKHKPGHSYCILTDGNFSPLEQKKFSNILKAKESNRHKELKNKIGQLLQNIEGVEKNSIKIDNKFIIKLDGKRKPDVYCRYNDKEIVFEIQLSDLSLGYILSRCDFYKKHGIYLIWILDNFDKQNQGTLERDIKYLTKYENFFKLDESAETFRLLCDYKFPFLTDENEYLTKWITKSVSLEELSFDSEIFQAYYFNFGDNKIRIENLQSQKREELKETERKNRELEKLKNAENKAKKIITQIADFRKQNIYNFTIISEKIKLLNYFEITVLNNILNFENRSKSPLIKWIEEANQESVGFLIFIISTTEIKLDRTGNPNGKTPFQAVFENPNIHKFLVLQELFRSGYKLTESDKDKLENLKNQQAIDDIEYDSYYFYNKLTDRRLVKDVIEFIKLLRILESAKRKVLMSYKFQGNRWIAFANNAIQYYSEYWEYIELTFKHYGIWDEIIKSDNKGTFQKKIEKFYAQIPVQKYDFDKLFQDLFSDVK